MSKRSIAIVLTMLLAAPATALQAAPVQPAPPPSLSPVIEFYHSGLDHYFMTADPREIAILDSGGLTGWRRTGGQFTAFASAPADAVLSPVCRYYGLPQAGLDSTFYSASPQECAEVQARFPSAWELESDDVFQVGMADPNSGACPSGYAGVERLYNNRKDVNHRYASDPTVVQAMMSRGYVLEGYGAKGTAFCVPSAPTTPVSPSASIVTTQVAVDTFQLSGIGLPTGGSRVASYAWDYGDGETASGPTNWHRFGRAGVFPVALTVTDSKGAVAKATQTVTAAAHVAPAVSRADADSDFARRRSAPGVVRWFDFDTPAQLGPRARTGNFSALAGTAAEPVIDNAVSASGGGSLRFDVPPRSSANAAGTWYANFSQDLATQFGENSEFYVQWRQRFSPAMVDTFFRQVGGKLATGIKQLIVTAGDQPGQLFASCEAIGTVVQTHYQRRFPIAYNSCTGSASHGPYAGFYEKVGGAAAYLLQNGLPSPSCPYAALSKVGQTTIPSACVGWVADEWMTFQVGITLGARDNAKNEFENSRFRMWVAREGEPSRLVIDWRPGVAGYFQLTAGPATQNQRYGKVYLLPYMTNKDPQQDHELAQTWYDEVIIATQRIPDPAPAGASVAASGDYPAWRKNRPVGKMFDIPGTEFTRAVDPDLARNLVDHWDGLAAGPTTWWSAANGGHGEWRNPTLKIDLAADQPSWVVVNPGSAESAVVQNSPYYTDGLPVSRHGYYSGQYLDAEHARDGVERVMLFGVSAAYAVGRPGMFDHGPQVDGFRVKDGKWDPAGTWASMPYNDYYVAVARDPRTGEVYAAAGDTPAGDRLLRWSPKTGTWARMSTTPKYPSPARMLTWTRRPLIVDTKRNRLVTVLDASKYGYRSIGFVLQTVDLATATVSNIPITGALPANSGEGKGFVYDADGDRYVFFQHNGAAPVGVYAIDPETGASTLITTTRAPLTSIEGRVAYFQRLGGIAYLAGSNTPIVFLPTR